MGNFYLDIYADEVFHDKKWMYIGALFVPIHKKAELLNELLNCRCIKRNSWNENSCLDPCGFHEKNNTEIHYKDVKSNNKFRIAQRWLKFLLETNNKEDRCLVYFNILGLDLSKIDYKLFDPKNRKMSIYTRFFRTVLLGGIKYFFGGDVIINHIFHDKGQQQHYNLFSWQPAEKITMENNIIINNKTIIFIDSDHREESSYNDESHFIQFLDIIMGSICCCFHPPTNNNKLQLGETIRPLLVRLTKNPKNVNSSYHYYRKQEIQFFPKNKLKDEPHEMTLFNESLGSRSNNNFYTKREILIKPHNQITLDSW